MFQEKEKDSFDDSFDDSFEIDMINRLFLVGILVLCGVSAREWDFLNTCNIATILIQLLIIIEHITIMLQIYLHTKPLILSHFCSMKINILSGYCEKRNNLYRHYC